MKRLLVGALLLSLGSMHNNTLAQIVNPDFEGRNAVPSTYGNVGPARQVSFAPYSFPDDLQAWDGVKAVNRNPNDTYTGSNYVSTDGTGYGNFSDPNGYYYTNAYPHSGKSSVLLQQNDQNGDHHADQFITEKLATPLTPGHSYQFQFWAKRLLPSPAYHTKLALFVTTDYPTFDFNQNTITPSPGNKVIESGDIQPDQNWTLVSGTIFIPAGGDPNYPNQWLTIGFSRKDQQYDASLPNNYPTNISYLIDDVSLSDMGCFTPTVAVGVTAKDPEPCPDISQYFTINNFNPDYTYAVTIIGRNANSLPAQLGNGTNIPNNATFRIKGGSGQTSASFSIAATNKCDGSVLTGPSRTYTAYFSDCSSNGSSVTAQSSTNQFTLYPNPGSNSVLIGRKELPSELPDEVAITKVRVYDSYGQLRLEQAVDSKKSLLLQTGALPTGVYIVHIMQGTKILTRERLYIQ